MLSTEKLKEIDPRLEKLSEDQITEIQKSLYSLGQLIFEDWNKHKKGSKYPVRDLLKIVDKNKISLWQNKKQKEV